MVPPLDAGPIVVVHHLEAVLEVFEGQDYQHIGEEFIVGPLVLVIDYLVDDFKVSRRVVLVEGLPPSLLDVLDQLLHPPRHLLLPDVVLLQLQQFLLIVDLAAQLTHQFALDLPILHRLAEPRLHERNSERLRNQTILRSLLRTILRQIHQVHETQAGKEHT